MIFLWHSIIYICFFSEVFGVLGFLFSDVGEPFPKRRLGASHWNSHQDIMTAHFRCWPGGGCGMLGLLPAKLRWRCQTVPLVFLMGKPEVQHHRSSYIQPWKIPRFGEQSYKVMKVWLRWFFPSAIFGSGLVLVWFRFRQFFFLPANFVGWC